MGRCRNLQPPPPPEGGTLCFVVLILRSPLRPLKGGLYVRSYYISVMKKDMFLGATNLVFKNAGELRKNMTHSEMLLWEYLRQKPLGYKFRRQHPLGPFIADFYCHALKLVIEVDGSIHDQKDIKEWDTERQQMLEQEGLRFLRFTNVEVEKKFETVVNNIEQYIININQLKPQ